MMKKGFTLAEVLITLAIIGVVATMTLPALMTNTSEQQYKTGLRKGINTLTEAAQTNLALENWDYSLINDTTTTLADAIDNMSAHKYSLLGLLGARTSINIDTAPAVGAGEQFTSRGETAAKTTDMVVILKDGSSIMYVAKDTVATATNTAIQDDGLPAGFTIVYDVNGPKAPNIVSNCNGKLAGDTIANENPGDDTIDTVCNDRTKRIIRDQFYIQLRGNVAQPYGAAAKWAFNN